MQLSEITDFQINRGIQDLTFKTGETNGKQYAKQKTTW